MITFTSEIAECRRLWEQFSPHLRAWDDWELMNAFHDQSRFLPKFMTLETGGSMDGLIPLVEDTTDGSHELFGGSYPDGRVLWIRPEDFPEYFAALPAHTDFFDLDGQWVDALLARFPEYAANFAEQDAQYYLVPADFQYDFHHHIQQKFSKDKRKGFLRDVRKVREWFNPELVWSDADETETFFRLSVKNFGAESDHASEAGRQEVRRVVRELQKLGYLRTLAISINGEKQAVSLSAHYRTTWVSLYAASNNDFDSLGKLLNMETIQEGCRHRVDEINYMTGMSWKAAWHMQVRPCRTLRKPAREPGS